MTRTLSFVLVLGLATPVLAQTTASSDSAPVAEEQSETAAAAKEKEAAAKPEPTAPAPETFAIRQIDFGIQGVETDTNSSRFREYRALPTGIVLPFVHFKGNEKFWYDVLGENVLQRDARYSVDVRPGGIDIQAGYTKIPHLFGNDGRTLLTEQGTGNWVMSDTLQQAFQGAIERQFAISKPGVNFAFLNNLVSPSFEAANVVDLGLLREQCRLDVKLTRDQPLEVRVSYFHEARRGTRAAGTAFGFGTIVETPEPIQYRTQDYGLTAEYTRGSALVRGSFHYNEFTNTIQTETFDNPFRATDASDASAYQAPGSASIGGASFGRVSLPPDNKAVTGSLGFLVKFKGRSRLSADASLGQWTQDSPFMPMTSNTAVVVPNQGLPGSLGGEIKTFSFNTAVTSQPVDHLRLVGRFRRYDLSNDTPRIPFPVGYVRFDAVFEDIPRITVPYGYTADVLTLAASYDFGPATVEGGYRMDGWDRTFRETEKTTQNVGFVKVDVRAAGWLVLHATAEKGSRSFDHLDIEQSEHASFLEPGSPANLLAVHPDTPQTDGTPLCPAGTVCNLRYDQADRDLDRYGAHAELTPDGGTTTLTLSYIKGKDDYKENLFGLINADNEAMTAEVDFTPTDRVNVYGFYSRENISTFQRGRQSGATVSNNRLDDWTSAVEDTVDSIGGGATLGVVKDKADLKLYGNYQKVDGNNDITSPPGGAPQNARRTVGGVAGIPLFDDTKIYTLGAELAYRATQQLTVGVGGWYESYRLQDSNTVGLANFVPASFFLAAADSDYNAHVLYVRASYIW
jgi:MtrB/PioB family decaheme-associated outer membrane protein